jgi:signal transduction histidine kinase
MAGEFLMDAITKQTERLRRFYGIDVSIKSEISSDLKGRVAAEAFHIVAEGLSNVLRHTSAKNAFVNVQCENASLMLEIGNDSAGTVSEFTPRSISERVKALGGDIRVEHRADHKTVVHVKVPL